MSPDAMTSGLVFFPCVKKNRLSPLECFPHSEHRRGKTGLHRSFFLFDRLKERTLPAIVLFLRLGALDSTAAKSARHDPAGPSCIRTTMNTVQLLVRRRRAHAEFSRQLSPRMPLAMLEVPAIQFGHDRDPPPWNLVSCLVAKHCIGHARIIKACNLAPSRIPHESCNSLMRGSTQNTMVGVSIFPSPENTPVLLPDAFTGAAQRRFYARNRLLPTVAKCYLRLGTPNIETAAMVLRAQARLDQSMFSGERDVFTKTSTDVDARLACDFDYRKRGGISGNKPCFLLLRPERDAQDFSGLPKPHARPPGSGAAGDDHRHSVHIVLPGEQRIE